MTEYLRDSISAICSFPQDVVMKLEGLQKLIAYHTINLTERSELPYVDLMYDFNRHICEVYEEICRRYGLNEALRDFWQWRVLDCLGIIPEATSFSETEGSDYYDPASFADVDCALSNEAVPGDYELLLAFQKEYNLPCDMLLMDAMMDTFGFSDSMMFLMRFPAKLMSYGKCEEALFPISYASASVSPSGALWVLSSYPVMNDPEYSFYEEIDEIVASVMTLFRPTFFVGVAKQVQKEIEQERRDDCA